MFTLDFGFGPLEAEFWRWMFLMTRIGAAMLAAPLFGTANVSPQVRVIVTGAVALLVANWTNAAAPEHIMSAAGVMAVLGELLIGLSLGFVMQFAFATPTIAAEIISGGMGMGLAASVDPQNGQRSPVLGQYFGVVLMLVFFAAGGHLQWIALLVKSYRVFPPGHVLVAGGFGPEHFRLILGFTTGMFATAVTMALPVTLVLLLVQVMTGVLSRSAPALNLFALGLPAGIVAGVAALIASSPLLTDHMVQLSADAITAATRVIAP